MNKMIIKNYVEKITKEDIYDYCDNEGLAISENEVNIIYDLLKHELDKMLGGNFLDFIEGYRHYFSESVFNLIISKYNKYKAFID